MNKRTIETGIRKNVLLKTNILVCTVIVLGFIVTTLVGYRANQQFFYKDMENVTTLTSEGIYHEIDSIFTKPINISLTMANDSLLKEFLEEELEHSDDRGFIETMRIYLNSYREKYSYDSIFLASVQTGRYYNFNGLDRTLEPEDPENVWFYTFLEQPAEYTINIDNDEVAGAGNDVTVFINCRIRGADGAAMGVVGVGFKVNSLQALLRSYEDNFGVNTCLVDKTGKIKIATECTGYEGDLDFFSSSTFPELKDDILKYRGEEAQAYWHSSRLGSGYVVSRYIPNLGWQLIVEHDTTALHGQLASRLHREVMILLVVIAIVLITITNVIRRYNKRIIELTVTAEKEHHAVFQEAAEQLYENIYEIDITHNRAANEATADYFVSLGAPPNIPFDKALQVIAEKQIKEEYRQGYLDTFSPEHVLKVYDEGVENLRYEFLISNDGKAYYWMRITAHIFFWSDDNSVRLLVYRQNIDAEKQREQYLFARMQEDSLTGLLNKATTQERIRSALLKYPDKSYAFFILDIDNFKEVNDRLGHAAGDTVLVEFANLLREQFREHDIVGRIGGDEFVIFIPIPDEKYACQKAETLSSVLQKEVHVDTGTWKISVSIGMALAPRNGTEFECLYKKADTALYEIKKFGKNGFTVYREDKTKNSDY